LMGLVHCALTETPVVIITPDTQVFTGERVTMRCDIKGGVDPKWTYSWNKNNNVQQHGRAQEFSIDSVTHTDSGTYTCTGRSGSRFSQTSAPVTLSVS
ncbi:Fc receptor-like protein 5 isoform X1, partial [Clarias magur]